MVQPEHSEAYRLLAGPRVKAAREMFWKSPPAPGLGSERLLPQQWMAGLRLQCHLVAACIFQHAKSKMKQPW